MMKPYPTKHIAQAALRVTLLMMLLLTISIPDIQANPQVARGSEQTSAIQELRSQMPGSPTPAALLAEAQQAGTVQVIVGLNIPFQVTAQMTDQQIAAQKATVSQARLNLLEELSAHDAVVLSDSSRWTIPFIALEVDEKALRALHDSPAVTSIEENRRNDLLLDSAAPVIRAPEAWALGYTGAEQTVAIVDSGVDRSHPFLENRVVAEACFSGHGLATESNCPNFRTSQVGVGAASPAVCFGNTGDEGCAHGTHVAGAAAGYQSASFAGTAPDANIIGVNVFSADLGAYNSDLISGLNYVYELRTTYSIAAVNMSLGSGNYSSSCNTTSTSMTSMFNLLRTAGIAPVVATGNSGHATGISFPSCISHAVSVGASDDLDNAAYFSNRSATLQTLFAPGHNIKSSVPINSVADEDRTGFATWDGTSMAAPLVAGAFAAYRQYAPGASVDDIVNRFRSYGRGVCVTGGSVPRLDLYGAIMQISPSAPCPTAPPPSNDLPANATVVTSLPYSAVQNDVAQATTSAGDPSFCSPVSETVWYRYTAPGAQSVTITTENSNYDTVLAVFDAATMSSVSCNDDYYSGVAYSKVTISATAGTSYLIAIGSYLPAGGSELSGGATLALSIVGPSSPTLVTQPQSQTIFSGQKATLYVTANGGTMAVNYQWYRGTAPDTSTPVGTNSSTYTTPALTASRSHWVRVTNTLGQVDSVTAVVTVEACPTFPSTIGAGDTAALIKAMTCANINGPTTHDVINLTDSSYVLSDGYSSINGLPNVRSASTVGTLIINGNGATIMRSTANGTPFFRILEVESSGNLSLNDLTVSNGVHPSLLGGGIASSGTLSLSNVTISGNMAYSHGGISNSQGTLTISDSAITGNVAMSNGGGIFSNSGLTVINSTISGNIAGNFGGGISQTNTATIIGSTLSNNIADTWGGGYGLLWGTVKIINSTLSGNAANGTTSTYGGGAFLSMSSDPVFIINSTIVSNTAAIAARSGLVQTSESGTITLQNSIVADNNGANNCLALAGTFGDNGNNLDNGTTCGFGATSLSSTNPLLGPLAMNGGPTLTRALLPGSPAINAGSNALAVDQIGATLTTDQRGAGFPRVVGDTVDIGAYESQGATLSVQLTLQGRPPAPNAQWVTTVHVTLYPAGSGTPILTQDFISDSSGQFAISGLTSGTYDLVVKGTHTLARRVDGVVVSAGGSSLSPGVSLEGDASDNNVVNIGDFSILAAAFGSVQGGVSYDARADFNSDTAVTISDFSLLASSFGQAGDGGVSP